MLDLFDISEKTEKKIKIGINCFIGFVVLMVVVFCWSSSQYSDADHKLEQGELPVYVTPPTAGDSTTQDIVDDNKTPEELDLSQYKTMKYEAIVDACSKNKGDKIVITATVYSVMETQSSIIYNLADADGNYYSVIDQTNNKQTKYAKATVVTIYGVPNSTSKLNNQEIPQLRAHLIEKAK